ncbi:MAG: diacylglycerol kinase family protein [Planctomycetota bacterium]
MADRAAILVSPSVLRDEPGLVEASIAAVEGQWEVVCRPEDGADMPRQIACCRESSASVVVGLGGDGTINAAASIAIETGAVLAAIPRGTMNLLTGDFGIGTDANAALESLGTLVEARVDYATVNGRVFLHSSLVGVVPWMAVERESIRDADSLRDKLTKLADFVGVGLEAEELELRLTSDAGTDTISTRNFVVTNNRLAERGLVSHARATLDAGRLGVYASTNRGPLATLLLFTTIGTGKLSEDPATLTGDCEWLDVEFERDSVLVSNDGEVWELIPPLEYRIHPRGLRVLVPAEIARGGRP